MALAGAALLPAVAQAQSVWGGAGSSSTTPDYNLPSNWSTNPGPAPTASGSSAQFASTGLATVTVTAGPIAPDSWTFNSNSQSYSVTGAAINFSNAATVTNNASAGQAISIANNMTGTTLTQNGASTLTVSGTNSFTSTDLAAGTLINNGSLTSTISFTGSATFTNNSTVTGAVVSSNVGDTFYNNSPGTVSGLVISAGTGTNSGTLNGGLNNAGGFSNSGAVNGGLTNSGTYGQTAGSTNGGTTNTGTINASGGGFSGAIANNTAGAFNITGGTVTTDSTFTNNNTATLSVTGGSFTGITTLTNNSTNAAGISISTGMTLSATNISNSAGATIANSGTLTATTGPVGNAGTLNNLLAASIINGGLSNTAGTTTNNGTINGGATVTGGTLTNNWTITGPVNNAATFNNNANGTVSGLLTNTAGTTTNGGTISGSATIGGGTVFLTGTGSIGGSLVRVGTGVTTATFDISGTSAGASIHGLAGASDGIVTLGSQTLTSSAGSSVNFFSGAINGSGGLTVTGGFQNLDGANTYTGVTTINSGGYLAVEGTGTIASSSKLVDNGNFDLSVMSVNSSITSLSGTNTNANLFLGNHSLTLTAANDTFAGIISGNGGLALTSGTETLTGANTYIGATTINGGTLTINGSIATSSLTTVNTGGTLNGTGTVGSTTISGGTFAPGNGTPASSMTVNGNLVFQSAAFFMVQINPTTASFANVTGNATLGGATVKASFAAGSYVAKQYTIVKATGTVSGTFNPAVVSTNLPSNLHPTLSYDAHDAYLNLALNFAIPGSLNGNQQNVGNALTNFFNTTGSIPLVFSALTPAGLSQASGETATGSQQTTFDAMTQFMGIMTDPFIGDRGDGMTAGTSATPFAEEFDAANAYAAKDPARSQSERDAYAAIYRKAPAMVAPFNPPWSVWAAGFGGSQTTNGNTTLGSSSTTSRLGAVAVGADYRFSPNTIAGIALAGGGTNFSVANGGTGRSDLFQAGAFVRHTVGPAYFTAALAYGWQDITTDRTVTIAGIDQLRAHFNANAWSGRIEDGYRFVTPWMGVTPYAAAQFTTFDLPAYAEQALVGANTFALAYGSKSVTATRSEVGVRTDKSWAMPDSILTLRGRFAWAHDYNPDRSIGATFQTLPGASFVVNGAAQSADKALTTASAELKWRSGVSLAATFEGEFSSNSRSYAGKGVARYQW
jgi:uncharacterized protein with beta-barrel porin domain